MDTPSPLLTESLVGVVDAQLLEGVGLKVLEAEDVQHACRYRMISGRTCE